MNVSSGELTSCSFVDPTTNGCDDRGYNVNTAYSYSVHIHLMDDLKSLLSPVIRQIKEVVKKLDNMDIE